MKFSSDLEFQGQWAKISKNINKKKQTNLGKFLNESQSLNQDPGSIKHKPWFSNNSQWSLTSMTTVDISVTKKDKRIKINSNFIPRGLSIIPIKTVINQKPNNCETEQLTSDSWNNLTVTRGPGFLTVKKSKGGHFRNNSEHLNSTNTPLDSNNNSSMNRITNNSTVHCSSGVSKNDYSQTSIHIGQGLRKISSLSNFHISNSGFPLNINNYINSGSPSIKIADLLKWKEIFNEVYHDISFYETMKFNNIPEKCKNYLSYYFTSSLPDKFGTFFTPNNRLVIISANNWDLFTFCFVYQYYKAPKSKNNFFSIFKNIFSSLNINFLLIVQYILLIMPITPKTEKEYRILTEITKLSKVRSYRDENEISHQIKVNCVNVVNHFRKILQDCAWFNEELSDYYKETFNNISKLSNNDIYDIFIDKFSDAQTGFTAITYNTSTWDNKVHKNGEKKYALVLDWDETLIYFDYKCSTNTNKGNVFFRPGLFDFLGHVNKYYDWYIFTSNSKEYSDPIINAIESNQTYFVARMYKENLTYSNGIYYKDISLVDKDISKIIIVDDSKTNFGLHEENGILIFPFWENNKNDKRWQELEDILLTIAINGYDDVREGIRRHSKEIFMKVSSK